MEAEEIRRSSLWWMQWRWMGRVTAAAGLVISLGTYYLLQNSALPLETALSGVTSQHQAIQIAGAGMNAADESAVIVGADL
jgi:uncharacterized membrane protein